MELNNSSAYCANKLPTVYINRLLKASPYIGEWNTIRTLLGTTWWNDPGVDFRVLTDLEEVGNFASLQKLHEPSTEIHDLPGLHAKVYIFDSHVLVSIRTTTRCHGRDLSPTGRCRAEQPSDASPKRARLTMRNPYAVDGSSTNEQ